MEERGKGSKERMLRMRNEKEFYDLIERRYKEQGFILWEDNPSVRYVEPNEHFSGVSFEDDETSYSKDGIESLNKIFAF